MDCGSTYIKMADCPEIQEQSKCQVGYSDLMKLWGHDQINIDGYRKGSLQIDAYDNLFIHGWWRGKSSHVWLPKQDQLQEMINWKKDFKAPVKIRLFHSWIFEDSNRVAYCQQFDSLEKLWLAFYMHEKHQKVWSTKENQWIKK